MNTNCLEGMACPDCQSEGPFTIAIAGWASVTDLGTDEIGDIDWDEDSDCICETCESVGTVASFRLDYVKPITVIQEVT